MTAIARGSMTRIVVAVAVVFVVATGLLFRTKPAGPLDFVVRISVEEIQRGMDIRALPTAGKYDYF